VALFGSLKTRVGRGRLPIHVPLHVETFDSDILLEANILWRCTGQRKVDAAGSTVARSLQLFAQYHRNEVLGLGQMVEYIQTSQHYS
jgi:hypothetical protein